MRRMDGRRTAKGVPDEQLRRGDRLRHEARGGHEVGDRSRVGRGAEIPVALAQPGEVEPQHRDPAVGERPADHHRGTDILGAGEAVREDRHGVGGTDGGEFEPSDELRPLSTGEDECPCCHGWSGNG